MNPNQQGILQMFAGNDPIQQALLQMQAQQPQVRPAAPAGPPPAPPMRLSGPAPMASSPSRPASQGPQRQAPATIPSSGPVVSPGVSSAIEGISAGLEKGPGSYYTGPGPAFAAALKAGHRSFVESKKEQQAAEGAAAEEANFQQMLENPEVIEKLGGPSAVALLRGLGARAGGAVIAEKMKKGPQVTTRKPGDDLVVDGQVVERGAEAVELTPQGQERVVALGLPGDPSKWTDDQRTKFREDMDGRFKQQHPDRVEPDWLTDQARNLAAAIGLPRSPTEWTEAQRERFEGAYNRLLNKMHGGSGGGAGGTLNFAFDPEGNPILYNNKTGATMPVAFGRTDPTKLSKAEEYAWETQSESENAIETLRNHVPSPITLGLMEKYPTATLSGVVPGVTPEDMAWIGALRAIAATAAVKTGRSSNAMITSNMLEFTRGVTDGKYEGSPLDGAVRDYERTLVEARRKKGGGGSAAGQAEIDLWNQLSPEDRAALVAAGGRDPTVGTRR